MGQKVTIGGDRVGSGKKMKAELYHYFRSTHNLSEKWASSMSPGILYPCLCKLAMRGDTFDIEMNADARTIPTQGALFGSYKMQLDVYQVPVRLYQALLHNNPLALGLKMNQVKFPLMNVQTIQNNGAMSNSCLLKYLGLSGTGTIQIPAGQAPTGSVNRKINAIPMLAYYDIFKNYYANKQEDYAYLITTTEATEDEESDIQNITYDYKITHWNGMKLNYTKTISEGASITFYKDNRYSIITCSIKGQTLNNNISLEIESGEEDVHTEILKDLAEAEVIKLVNVSSEEIIFSFSFNDIYNYFALTENSFKISIYNDIGTPENITQLTPFELKNIDDMRYDILSFHELGSAFTITNAEGGKGQYLPYSAVTDTIVNGKNANQYPLNGLVVKTYQNDIFNNWLNSDWIEGENSINELTKVSVEDGKFSMDALNMAQKLYNMLNRVAISGGTYEDYQDVVWEEVKRRQIESPIYCGGMSREIMFDEVIQTAPADGDPLGTIGGRGTLAGKQKGGKLHIKCDEACFIIGIISLTPRVFYTQGNEFYLTEIMSFDDLHKPALDGIGFQNLIGERLAWWNTTIRRNTDTIVNREAIGKLPAWIEYMTSYDRAFGDFAEPNGRGYMILNRNYEQSGADILDATTYIDPRKYNYAFAYSEIDAQNFWVEIGFNIKARRLMSARLIPNV